uniref:Uncharacterized protein n=1 Tax=Schizaphis graminum TaxID=13262 RepID=A0A2S2PP69_SCHGA
MLPTNKVIAAAENVNVIKAPCARAIDCGEFQSFVVSLFFLLSRSHLRFLLLLFIRIRTIHRVVCVGFYICYNTNTHTHIRIILLVRLRMRVCIRYVIIIIMQVYTHYPAREFPFVSLA